MNNKLFVGNLHRNIRWQELKEFFGQRGEVAYTSVVMDRETQRSRGFGFVTFVNEADALKAKQEANEQEVNGRKIYLDFANEEKPKESETNQENLPHEDEF